MPDPYAPRVARSAAAPETQGDKANVLMRLRRLGLNEADLAEVDAAWDVLTADWTPETRSEFARLSDPELRAAIDQVNEEYRHSTEPPTQDEADAAAQEAYERALAEAFDRIGGNVASLLAWVGADTVRAEAVLALEAGEGGAMRKTLTEPLLALLAEAG